MTRGFTSRPGRHQKATPSTYATHPTSIERFFFANAFSRAGAQLRRLGGPGRRGTGPSYQQELDEEPVPEEVRARVPQQPPDVATHVLQVLRQLEATQVARVLWVQPVRVVRRASHPVERGAYPVVVVSCSRRTIGCGGPRGGHKAHGNQKASGQRRPASRRRRRGGPSEAPRPNQRALCEFACTVPCPSRRGRLEVRQRCREQAGDTKLLPARVAERFVRPVPGGDHGGQGTMAGRAATVLPEEARCHPSLRVDERHNTAHRKQWATSSPPCLHPKRHGCPRVPKRRAVHQPSSHVRNTAALMRGAVLLGRRCIAWPHAATRRPASTGVRHFSRCRRSS